MGSNALQQKRAKTTRICSPPFQRERRLVFRGPRDSGQSDTSQRASKFERLGGRLSVLPRQAERQAQKHLEPCWGSPAGAEENQGVCVRRETP